MEDDFNSLNFFIVEQQKSKDFLSPRGPFDCNCCLNILIYMFNMFKGAARPRHTYVCGFKGECLWG